MTQAGVLTVLPLVSAGNGLTGNMWTSERAIRTRNIKYYGKTIFDVSEGKTVPGIGQNKEAWRAGSQKQAVTRPPKHAR